MPHLASIAVGNELVDVRGEENSFRPHYGEKFTCIQYR